MKQFLLTCYLLIVVISNQSFAQAKKKSIPAKQPATESAPPQQQAPPEVAHVVGDPTKDNVAIYPFTSAVGYDYDYAQSMGSAVESGFVRSARFNVLERNRFGSISAEERFKKLTQTML